MDAFDSSLRNWKTSSCLAEFFLAQTIKELQLHVFCDASTTAYAAVVYMRHETSQGTTHVKMMTAKTRVAPIKCICVPRMELCAALLGWKLVEATLAAISDTRFIIPTFFACPTLKLQLRGYESFLASGRLSLLIE